MQHLRQSTAGQVVSFGQFVDSTDFNTEENALTILNTDIKIRKNLSTILVNKNSGGATNVSNGVYHSTFDATDTNTTGKLEVYIHIAGSLPVKSIFMVLTATAYDALYSGTFNNLGGAEVQSEVNDGLVAFWTSPATLVDLVWDEVLTGATHNVNNSSGKRLRQVATTIFSQGTAQSATANQIQLAPGAISLDNQFVRSKIILIAGTGAGQEAIITNSVASTDTLTVSPSWLVTPNATTQYEILPAQSHSTVRNGGYDNGAVYVDVSGGTNGVLIGVNGISDKPVLTLAEARIIADEIDVQKFVFDRGIGLPTLDQDYVGWRFEVRSGTAFNLNSKDVSFSVFDRATVTGTALNTSGVTVYETCGIIALTCGESNFLGCGLINSLTMNQVNKRYSANNLFSNGTIGTIPEIIFAGDGINPIFFEASATGEYVIKGMTAADTLQIMGQCIITLHSTCIGGKVITSGDVAITDNSTGGAMVFSSGMTRDILTDTATTIPAQITALNDISVADVLTTAMTEAYAADGVAPTLAQAIFIIKQNLENFAFTGTTKTVRAINGTTTVATYTLDDAVEPTSSTRAT